jgi:hypothetical protein
VHPFRGTTRPYFTLGGAHMRAPGSFPTHEEPTRPEAASLLVSQRTTFAYGGAGYNVTTRRGLQHPNFFSVVGASLVLAQTNRYQTGEVPAQTQQEAPPLFLPYFEVGARYFAENSSP